MNKYQQFAVEHYLNSWPENMSYDEILTALENDHHEDIWPCFEYETLPPDNLADLINEMAINLDVHFGDANNEHD